MSKLFELSEADEMVKAYQLLVRNNRLQEKVLLQTLEALILKNLGLAIGDIVQMGDKRIVLQGVTKAETVTPGLYGMDFTTSLPVTFWNLDRITKVNEATI